jgi:hypothetical protein
MSLNFFTAMVFDRRQKYCEQLNFVTYKCNEDESIKIV